jgi:hypothetical protein
MSTPQTKKVFKIFLPWQEEKECAWLAEQSAKGWHVYDAPWRYHFAKGKPRDLVYCLDFRSERPGLLGEYFQLCKDAGWEHAFDKGYGRYFRAQRNTNFAPAFFSDTASQIAKYKRVALPSALLVFLTINFLWTLDIGPDVTKMFPLPLLIIVHLVMVLFIIMLGFLLGGALFKIRRLKRQEDEA